MRDYALDSKALWLIWQAVHRNWFVMMWGSLPWHLLTWQFEWRNNCLFPSCSNTPGWVSITWLEVWLVMATPFSMSHVSLKKEKGQGRRKRKHIHHEEEVQQEASFVESSCSTTFSEDGLSFCTRHTPYRRVLSSFNPSEYAVCWGGASDLLQRKVLLPACSSLTYFMLWMVSCPEIHLEWSCEGSMGESLYSYVSSYL